MCSAQDVCHSTSSHTWYLLDLAEDGSEGPYCCADGWGAEWNIVRSSRISLRLPFRALHHIRAARTIDGMPMPSPTPSPTRASWLRPWSETAAGETIGAGVEALPADVDALSMDAGVLFVAVVLAPLVIIALAALDDGVAGPLVISDTALVGAPVVLATLPVDVGVIPFAAFELQNCENTATAAAVSPAEQLTVAEAAISCATRDDRLMPSVAHKHGAMLKAFWQMSACALTARSTASCTHLSADL